MGCFIDTKQKKLLDISVSLAQLLLQMENDWDDHLLKAAHFHSSTSSGMRKELILVYVRRHFVLYMDSLKSDCKCFVKRNFQRKIAHQTLENIRKPIVTEHFYHDVFVKEFNIGF